MIIAVSISELLFAIAIFSYFLIKKLNIFQSTCYIVI